MEEFMRFTRWDEVASTECTNDKLQELALWHWQQVSKDAAAGHGQIGQAIIDLDVRELCRQELGYGNLAVSDAIHLRQILAFFSKRSDVDIGVDKEAAALTKFAASEQACLETNILFRQIAAGTVSIAPAVDAVLHRAQRKIAKCLGDVPPLKALKVKFGPGATTQVKKTDASARAKLGQPLACSEEFAEVAQQCVSELPGWLEFQDVRLRTPETYSDAADAIDGDETLSEDQRDDLKELAWTHFEGQQEQGCPIEVLSITASASIEIQRGKLNFVPKNAKTFRSVWVEPMLNSMFQLGVGQYMADRLRQEGVDISDQTRNQRFARLGSLTGEVATLDLSSASDTIARELVFHLLPVDWALFLDQFCTRDGEYKGRKLRRLQKFSSMGNGFTFPLETLIFWALACACTPDSQQSQVSVYGDDIIVPTGSASFLSHVLAVCGFEVNAEKSFTSGPFRESCGADYLSGIDIRPCYIKEPLSGMDCFRLYNFYARQFMSEPANIVLSWISEPLRLWGPDGYGDGHLVGDYVPMHHNRDRGWGGFTFDTYTWVAPKSTQVYPGDHVLPCYSIYVKSEYPAKDPDEDNAARRFLTQISPPPVKGGGHISERSVAPDNQGVMYVRKRKSKGVLAVTLPGRKGYKRVKIYTLAGM
nr:MAG: hypothetical protein 3 [Leviviridae sp.]